MKKIRLLTAGLLLLNACAQTDGGNMAGGANDAINSTSAIAAAIVSGTVAQASGQDLGFFPENQRLRRLEQWLLPVQASWAAAACPTYAAPLGATCAGQTITLAYTGCSFGNGDGVWTGSQTLTFGGTAVCGTTNLPLVSNGDTLTRRMLGTIPAGTATVRTSSTGLNVSFDTSTATGYSTAVSGGTVVTGNGTGQSVSIAGINMKSAFWDFTASTVAGQPLVVVSPGANRTIQSGTVLVQHNTARYSGTSVFSNVAFNSSSCLPQSGTITTTFSGSLNGQETLTFNGSGRATLVLRSGASVAFTMAHCF